MKKLLIATSAAALMAGAAFAAVVDQTDSATLELNGEIEVVCSITINGNDTETFTVDLDGNRLAPQDAGELAYGCNAPYSVTLASEFGAMKNLTAEADGADVKYRYGVSFGTLTATNGSPVGEPDNLDAYELSLTTGTPAEIDTADWAAIAAVDATGGGEYGDPYGYYTSARKFPINIEPDNSGRIAGEYEDTLTFTIASEL